jgi:hypothetical protein
MTPARNTLRRLTRLVLVWYVLFVGVSVLAATLQPKTMDVVCYSMGLMKVVLVDAKGQTQRVIGPPVPAMLKRWLAPS